MGRRHTPVIEQNNATGVVSYWQGPDNQSIADRRGISLADYIHAMYGFIRQKNCRNVLMIGCGGGTLATMLRRVRVSVTIVDIDPNAFEIARNYFHLPDDIPCHAADGIAFLKRDAKRYDAIVLDAYSGGDVPKPLLTEGFFTLARSRLNRGGIFLANLSAKNDDDRTPDRIARRMQRVWPQVKLHDADGYLNRNVVAIAGAIRGLTPPRLTMRPNRGAKTIATSLRELSLRGIRD